MPPQSVTIPVQGFLNAIVYGWTRDDFLYVMSMSRRTAGDDEETVGSQDKDEQLEDSGQYVSNKREHSFTRTLVHTDDDDDT